MHTTARAKADKTTLAASDTLPPPARRRMPDEKRRESRSLENGALVPLWRALRRHAFLVLSTLRTNASALLSPTTTSAVTRIRWSQNSPAARKEDRLLGRPSFRRHQLRGDPESQESPQKMLKTTNRPMHEGEAERSAPFLPRGESGSPTCDMMLGRPARKPMNWHDDVVFKHRTANHCILAAVRPSYHPLSLASVERLFDCGCGALEVLRREREGMRQLMHRGADLPVDVSSLGGKTPALALCRAQRPDPPATSVGY